MKVEVNEKKKERDFPKLMIHSDGTIVLFSNINEGICVKEGGNTNIGLLSTDFCMDRFKDFDGSITLSND